MKEKRKIELLFAVGKNGFPQKPNVYVLIPFNKICSWHEFPYFAVLGLYSFPEETDTDALAKLGFNTHLEALRWIAEHGGEEVNLD